MSQRNSATLRKLLLAVPVTILFSAACFAQTTSAIEGNVKGEDGQPVKGAAIKIVRKDIKGNYPTKTDKKGHYFYGGLPLGGTFRVSVEIDGKERDVVDNVVARGADPVEVNFDLKQSAARAQAGGQAPAKEQERGMSAEQKAAYEKKLKDNEENLKKNKALSDAFNAGMDAQNAKQWDVAVQNFEKASALDPKQNVVWGHLADSYAALAKTKAGAEQDDLLNKSVAAYLKAIELKPDAPEYHNNYALALAAQKKFTDAQAELQKAAQLDPANAGKYYYNLGAVLVNTNQMEQASDAFKKAIEINDNYADAHYQYGLCLISKATTTPDGKMVPPPGTAEEFQKYLALEPNGQYAQPAKDMLQTIGSTVDTNFAKPGQKNQKKKQ